LDPLREEVKANGMWAAHLGPELGGLGYGQVKLALLNEILGRSIWGPRVFGTQAPDTGNAEILAHYGTAEQKAEFLEPLLQGDISSAYSMTEPHGGADPGVFTTRAERTEDGGWVVNGAKFFSSNARWSSFLILLAVTDPDAPLVDRMSMFLVPTDTPGVEIERHFSHWGEDEEEGSEALIRYTDVRLPASALLGEVGRGFVVAQTRLGGGRVHHAMRTVGSASAALEMMAERALSRSTKGEQLAQKQLVQAMLADSWIEIQQFRLLTLYTAWLIDQKGDYKAVRKEVAAIKIQAPRVMESVGRRAIQVHGALGMTHQMPLVRMYLANIMLGLADGPTEVHQVTLARLMLRDHEPYEGLWPRAFLPAQREAAEAELVKMFGNEPAPSIATKAPPT
jgi:acyl-CoA dehydrogenase